MQVAQAARPFLEVGFEVVGGVVEACVALYLLVVLCREILRRRPDRGRSDRIAQTHRDLRIAGQLPRPEQIAVAKFLGMRSAIDDFHESMIRELQLRLDLLFDRIDAMRVDGLPVRAIAPQGAIYLSVQFDLIGRGAIKTNEQIRRLLLDDAGFAVVPFQAFGLPNETGWFRLSVGAVSPAQIEAGLARVRHVLAQRPVL